MYGDGLRDRSSVRVPKIDQLKGKSAVSASSRGQAMLTGPLPRPRGTVTEVR